MGKRTLGLDLGPNSIGWALIDEEAEEIIGLGVRVFQEGVANFDTGKEVSRNEERRTMRGMRRQVRRRARRRRQLRDALAQAGLFPSNSGQQVELCQLDPYQLRADALSRKLTPHELGRVFFHLAQRRGFLSNAKHDRGDKEVKGILEEMGQLALDIESAGCQTLGEFLHRKRASFDHRQRKAADHVRGRHTKRQMYTDEFNLIWERQCELGHADLLTDELKYGKYGNRRYPSRSRTRTDNESLLEAFGLYGLIFFQRKMYWPKLVIGKCELEPNQPRCPRGDRIAQWFRLLQEVNNLRYVDQDAASGAEERLSEEQRTLLLAKLAEKEKMTFDQIRKALGFTESVHFNLEKGKRSSLWGMVVDVRMAKAFGKAWHKRPDGEKTEIVRLILDNELDTDELATTLVASWGFTEEDAKAASLVDLPAGYIHFSRKALNRLLPHLESGMVLQSSSDPEISALHAAGYLRRDELQRRIFDVLPDPKRTRDCPIGDIPNPVVKRTLVELRKVVNAIIREYGRPDEIHLEMGRDVTTRPQKGTPAYTKYLEQLDERNRREKQRDAAAEYLRERNQNVTRDNITRVILWEQQNRECIYSGRMIADHQLFGGDVDVDHILPRSRSLDDSQNNKVVCFRSENADKGQDTPYGWLAAAEPQRYDETCLRASKHLKAGRFSYAKYKRFLQKEVELEDFIARQLNDTRYITRATGEYLRCLYEGGHQVLGLRGQHTSELRHLWGLNTVLAELPDSPAWQEQNKLKPFEKNRADHRHHAVDAVILALMNRSRLHALSAFHRQRASHRDEQQVLLPWETLRQDVKSALASIYVSHRANKKVRGNLHDEKPLAATMREELWAQRKPLLDLSVTEIPRIRDAKVRQLVLDRLKESGVDIFAAKKPSKKELQAALAGLTMPSGVPIKRVRLLKSDRSVVRVRADGDGQLASGDAFYKPGSGSNHHVCIFSLDDNGRPTRDVIFVSRLEAAIRVGNHSAVVSRIHPERPDAEFVMSLSAGETVLCDVKGRTRLLVYRTGKSTTGELRFLEHTESRKSDSNLVYLYANTLKGEKVTVDPLGRLRRAND